MAWVSLRAVGSGQGHRHHCHTPDLRNANDLPRQSPVGHVGLPLCEALPSTLLELCDTPAGPKLVLASPFAPRRGGPCLLVVLACDRRMRRSGKKREKTFAWLSPGFGSVRPSLQCRARQLSPEEKVEELKRSNGLFEGLQLKKLLVRRLLLEDAPCGHLDGACANLGPCHVRSLACPTPGPMSKLIQTPVAR